MQTTSPTWRGLFASGASVQARAIVGGVAYTDISAPVISRATMQDRLAVGNVVSASLALALRSAGSVPRSAAVTIEVRLNDGQTASEWLPQGTFYVSRRMRDPVTGKLALECYDALLKANAVWTPSAGAWPRALATVTAELAALLGVDLDSRTVIPTGAAYAMSQPAAGTTIRDALSLIAQAAGGNWIVTPAGRLRLVRLGEAGDTVDVAGVVGGIDVGATGTVTGVRSTVDGVVTLAGDDTGVVVDVAVAPVIAAELAEDLIGQAWQPFRLDGAIYDPAAELGDVVRAGAGGEVASALCSEQAAYGPAFRGNIAAPDPGEVTDEYPYLGSADKTLALAKAAVTEAVDRLDGDLTQQEIFNRLTDDGAAQGLVLYNGQLYINARYINTGEMNVERVNFNAPSNYFDIPDENDPDSLLSGQTVVNGWIVNRSGSIDITALSCSYAKPLRGRTITITFTFNGMLNSWHTSYSWLSDDGQMMGEVADGEFIHTPNPYTYAYTVPDDADSFSVSFTCSGLKQISASVSGDPVVFADDIQFTYDGLRVGDFSVRRSGDLFGFGKNIFDGIARFNGGVYFANPGAVRANLDITPANIGALSLAGGELYGNLSALQEIVAGNSESTLQSHVTAVSEAGQLFLYSDGTSYIKGLRSIDSAGKGRDIIRIDDDNNAVYYGSLNTDSDIVQTNGLIKGDTLQSEYTEHAIKLGHAGDAKMDFYERSGLFSFYQRSSGTDTLLFQVANGESDQPLPVNNGGTGATTPAAARANLGITPANIGAVNKAGDTMTGNLIVAPEGGGYVLVRDTDTNVECHMGTDPNGYHGLASWGYYDGSAYVVDAKWMVYRDTDGRVHVDGYMPDTIAGLGGNQTIADIESDLSQSGTGQVYYNDPTNGFLGWGYLSAICDGNLKTALCIAGNKIGLLHTDDGSNWTETMFATTKSQASGRTYSFDLPLNHFAIGIIGNCGVCGFWHAGNAMVAYGLNTSFSMTYSGDTITISSTLGNVCMAVVII